MHIFFLFTLRIQHYIYHIIRHPQGASYSYFCCSSCNFMLTKVEMDYRYWVSLNVMLANLYLCVNPFYVTKQGDDDILNPTGSIWCHVVCYLCHPCSFVWRFPPRKLTWKSFLFSVASFVLSYYTLALKFRLILQIKMFFETLFKYRYKHCPL